MLNAQLTLREKQDGLARIALDRRLISSHLYTHLLKAAPQHEVAEILLDLIAGVGTVDTPYFLAKMIGIHA